MLRLNSMVLSWLIWLLNCQAPTEMPSTVSRGVTTLVRSHVRRAGRGSISG
jgi:hypothetical protein